MSVCNVYDLGRMAARGLLLFSVISAVCGCKMMSNGAYGVANFLDPESRVSSASEISSTGYEGEIPGEIYAQQVRYPEQTQTPGSDPSNYQPAYDLASQVQDIQKVTTGLQEDLVGMKKELRLRGQALIDTRSQLGKVEEDVVSLRTDLKQWQLSMRQIHRQIRERDAKRLEALSQLASNITQQAEQAKTR